MLWLVLLCAALLSVGAAQPSTPSTNPDDYGLVRRIPDDCVPNTTCSYFVGLRVNTADTAYLDVYLSGSAMGWVAIGFSPSNDMDNSDVLGCSVETSTTIVRAIDTYNDPNAGGNSRFNSLDSSGQMQDDIKEGSMVFEGGRITCSFSRLIVGQDGTPSDDTPGDFNLDDDYFFLFGRGNSGRSSEQLAGFPLHEEIPPILGTFNPVRDAGELPLMASGSGAGPTTPVRSPADYRLRRRDPSGCDPESCDYFMGISTNSENTFLDFYLTADINGWVAVGFSRSSNMQDADVLGCKRGSASDEVSAIDTYNIVGDRLNSGDNNGNIRDIVPHNSSFANGRITCIFSRRIIGDDEAPEDRNLDEDYFFMFGLGNGRDGSNFPNHLPLIPQLSDGEFNPSTDSGDIGISRFRQRLLQTHGILMLIAWPLLAFTAIFFAAWMKQALPNGEWFQVHRAFHIAALFVAVVGFILAFVANKDASTPGLIDLGSENKSGTAHYVLGIIIMSLQIANPLIAIFRCKPKGRHRWIFNLAHGTVIGLGVEFLAYANIGIGVSIFSERESEFGDLTILWVYLAFVVFAVVLNSVLLLLFTGEAVMKGDEGIKVVPAVFKPIFSCIYSNNSSPEKIEMSQTARSEPSKPDGPPPRKPAAPDSPFRWIGLGLFLGVMIPLIVAVIVMIAATANS